MADPLDEFESEVAAKKQARANRRSRKQQTGETPVLRKPMFGYEQARQESIQGWGGTTIDGRKRNPKETVDAGPYKGMSPGEALNQQRTDYANSGMGNKQAATYRAEGGDIRTPQEVAAQGEFDRQQSLAMFGPQGSEPGRGNRMGKGGRKGQSPAAPSDPANPLTRPSVASQAAQSKSGQGYGDKMRKVRPDGTAVGSAPSSRSLPSMASRGKINGVPTELALKGETSQSMHTAASRVTGVDETGSDIKRNGSGKATAMGLSRQTPNQLKAEIAGLTPPSRPSFDRTAATSKATGEVASIFSDAAQKAPLTKTGDRSIALPQPPASGKAAATRGYMALTESAMKARNPNMVNPPSELPSMPKPIVAAARAGKMPATPAVTVNPDIAAYNANKPKGPTEFAPLAPSGGRKGAAPRVAASPLRTPSPAKIAQR